MHVRVTTTRRGEATYRYAQLVQSVRDGNGKSTTKVIKHLGRLPDSVIEALKVALRAESSGEALMLESDVAGLLDGQDIASREYLDIAALLRCAEHWGLAELIDDLGEASESEIPLSVVVLSLVVQRCVAPGSKLGATRWVPRTSLPELLGFSPESFNNTRVHRALTSLATMTPTLQKRLGQTYEANRPSSAFFMDVTDTYFEGTGCELSERTRTKNEIPNKRCIGIVLLANERGFPMRWKLVGGKTKDWTAMSALLRQMGEVPWMQDRLVVFDRAMGNRSTVTSLKESGLHFLTAAHRDAIKNWTSALPTDPFSDVELGATDESYEDDIEAVAQTARESGLTEIHEHLFVHELGVVEPFGETVAETQVSRRHRSKDGTGLYTQLDRATQMRAHIDAHPDATYDDVGELFDISGSRVRQLLSLFRICPEAQQRIREFGEDFPCTEAAGRKLLRLPADKQLAHIEQILAQADDVRTDIEETEDVGPLRMVAYFNPRLFVDMRNRAERHARELHEAAHTINSELATAKRSRKRATTYRKFVRELERRNYLDAFDIALEPLTLMSAAGNEIGTFRGTFTCKDDVWMRRRTYDGFVLLLGHPDLKHSGVDLVQRYRGKDIVEKSFQTIKSAVKLRPIFHYTDPKVTAHVSVCMLAVLLLKTLRVFLDTTDCGLTEHAALELLATCRLNQRQCSNNTATIYHPILADQVQQTILESLEWTDLVDPEQLRATITPRA